MTITRKERLELREKRKAIMLQINDYEDNKPCSCTYTPNGTLKKKCERCWQLGALGLQLNRASAPRVYVADQSYDSEVVVVEDIALPTSKPADSPIKRPEYNGEPVRYVPDKHGRMLAQWTETLPWLKENAKHYTVDQMCKKLEVTKSQLKNVYNWNGIEYKSAVKVYKYLIKGELIDIGTVRELSMRHEINPRTMRKWSTITGIKGQKLEEIK